MNRHLAFLFSLEAAFSLTLVMIAAAYLFAFVPQHEEAGEFAACSDVAGALAKTRAFSSQEKLQAAVDEAGSLLGACVEAEGAGWNASSCRGATSNSRFSFSFPVWSGGKLQDARVACHQET